MLKKIIIGIYAVTTVAIILMAAYTQTLGNTVLAEHSETATEDLEWNGGIPIEGAITLSSHSTMLESKPSWIFYNFSLEISSVSPKNLRVDYIQFVFTYPSNSEIELVGGISSLEGILEVVNATSVVMRGSLQITPIIFQANTNGFLGCRISFHYWDSGLPAPPTSNSSGEVAEFQLRPFTIIPAYLAQEPWFLTMQTFLLVWVVLAIYFVCNRAKP